MIRNIVTVLFFFTTIAVISAPKYNHIWYFGEGAGLDFRSGSPKALTDGQLVTWEGCGAICDSLGNLLFYTNGVTVWNRNHRQMPNGNGLYGNMSSTQSAVIIPKPGDDSTFYIFTAPDYSQGEGFSYSIVNLRLEVGLGDVSVKNVTLLENVTEKVTVIKHANNKDYWILTHKWESDEFAAYHLTSGGVISNMVISKIGSVINGAASNKVGCIKASTDGRMVSMVSLENPFIEIFDFNLSTGQLSNARKFESKYFTGSYCLEFSPDNTKMYLSIYRGNISNLYQLDLNWGNDFDIVNNMVNLGFYPSAFFYGAVQLGPDGKIYVAQWGSEYLGVINEPDKAGLGCNYVIEGVYLEGKHSKFGLPQSVPIVRLPEVNFTYDEPVCLGSTIRFSADSIYKLSYKWSGPGGFASDSRITAIYNVTLDNEGAYQLEITDSNGVQNFYFFNISVIENRFSVNNAADNVLGRTCPGQSTEKTFFVENKGSDPISLESAGFQNYEGVFAYQALPPFGTILKPGDITTLKIIFTPKEIKNYNDIVYIKSANPCSSEITFPIEAVSMDKTIISIPDTLCHIWDKNFRLPIYAELECATEGIVEKLSFEGEIRLNSDAFSVSDNNSIVSNIRIENGSLVLGIQADNIVLGSKKSKIGEIQGSILLPVSNTTPVDLTDFRWTNSILESDTNGGSLIITGDCLFDSKKVSSQNPGFLMAYPNPSDGIVNIKTDKENLNLNKTIKEIKVFDRLGRDFSAYVNNYAKSIAATENGSYTFDISSLAPGIYTVIINIYDELYHLKLVKY